jgi:hypothetical protein
VQESTRDAAERGEPSEWTEAMGDELQPFWLLDHVSLIDTSGGAAAGTAESKANLGSPRDDMLLHALNCVPNSSPWGKPGYKKVSKKTKPVRNGTDVDQHLLSSRVVPLRPLLRHCTPARRVCVRSAVR